MGKGMPRIVDVERSPNNARRQIQRLYVQILKMEVSAVHTGDAGNTHLLVRCHDTRSARHAYLLDNRH